MIPNNYNLVLIISKLFEFFIFFVWVNIKTNNLFKFNLLYFTRNLKIYCLEPKGKNLSYFELFFYFHVLYNKIL